MPAPSPFAEVRCCLVDEGRAYMSMLAAVAIFTLALGLAVPYFMVRRQRRRPPIIGYDPALDNLRRVLGRRSTPVGQRVVSIRLR